MKLGYLTYWCGWGLIATAITFVIGTILTGEQFSAFVIGRSVGALLFGLMWLSVGSKQITKVKLANYLETFRNRNCTSCRFLDKKFDKNSTTQGWCTRPEPPEMNREYCHSHKQDKD